jgi:hypothetical protein
VHFTCQPRLRSTQRLLLLASNSHHTRACAPLCEVPVHLPHGVRALRYSYHTCKGDPGEGRSLALAASVSRRYEVNCCGPDDASTPANSAAPSADAPLGVTPPPRDIATATGISTRSRIVSSLRAIPARARVVRVSGVLVVSGASKWATERLNKHERARGR